MSDNEEKESSQKNSDPQLSPFGTGPVDPLVYRQSNDSPELRPAPSYLSVGPQLGSRAPKPVVPQHQSHAKWTPGGAGPPEPVTQNRPASKAVFRILKRIAIVFAALSPIALIAFAAFYALRMM